MMLVNIWHLVLHLIVGHCALSVLHIHHDEYLTHACLVAYTVGLLQSIARCIYADAQRGFH